MKKINKISQKYNVLDLREQIIDFKDKKEITITTKIDNFIELENFAKNIRKLKILKKYNNIIINHNIKIEDHDISKIRDTDNLSFILGNNQENQQYLVAYIIF